MNNLDKVIILYHHYAKLYNQSTDAKAKLIYKAKAIAIGEVIDLLGLQDNLCGQSIEELLGDD